MSEVLQSGHHPDADQLSAFVDRALPEHERRETLAHLAVCQECRTIVALSLPVVEERPIPLAERPAPKTWWAGWNLAWPAATALAALIILMVYIGKGRTGADRTNAPTQMAASRLPAAPASTGSPAIPAAKSPPAIKSQSEAAGLAAASSAVAGRSSTGNGAAVISGRSVASIRVPSREFSDQDKMLQAAPPPTVLAAPQLQAEAKATNRSETTTVSVNAAGAAEVGGQVFEPQRMPPASISNEAVGSLTLNEVSVIRGQRPLPSRLPMLSIATHGRQVVAIDTGNAVFLSKDGGKRWKAVTVQWTGRAVKADLVSYGIAPIPAMGAVTAGLAASYSAPNPSIAPIEAASPTASSLSGPSPSGSSLTGTVTDKTGASIPGATVLVTDSVGHLARTAYTDRDGRYRVDGLSPGAYGVKVQAVGFNTQVLPFVTVVAAQRSEANVSLDVGAVTQTVTVEASADAISAPGRAKKSLTKSPSASPAAPVFEITTDNGDRWTSADGVAWKKK
jgi:hypothetical protein